MKFISVILSVIFLGLSFVPCADSMTPDRSLQKAATEAHHGGEDHHHHTDFCSPLCVCGCCGTTVAQLDPGTEFIIKTIGIRTSEKTIFRESLPSDLYYPIWEPPKII